MWVVDEILGSLKDGNWHNLSDIEKKCSSYEISVQVILNFLSEHDFIEIDKESLKVKLRPSTLEFINEIQRIEGDMRALRLR